MASERLVTIETCSGTPQDARFISFEPYPTWFKSGKGNAPQETRLSLSLCGRRREGGTEARVHALFAWNSQRRGKRGCGDLCIGSPAPLWSAEDATLQGSRYRFTPDCPSCWNRSRELGNTLDRVPRGETGHERADGKGRPALSLSLSLSTRRAARF